ncbi:hypothetical protein E4U55_006492 [Claviceps digitariae]|nr:hypothetical protein E4U55_006492 [Claviceps digitariae]
MAEENAKVSTMPETTRASPGADNTTEANTTTQPQQPPSTTWTPQNDTAMSDMPIEQVASPVPANLVASPAPARTGTPAQGSRAPSLHPDSGFSMPSEAPPHGDPTRQYLNTKVTGVLLEGMKQLAKDQPETPLRSLGEYLIQKSKELEGTT